MLATHDQHQKVVGASAPRVHHCRALSLHDPIGRSSQKLRLEANGSSDEPRSPPRHDEGLHGHTHTHGLSGIYFLIFHSWLRTQGRDHQSDT